MLYPAHIRDDASGVPWVQTVECHCRACACYASEAAPPGLEKTAYLCGLLHDMGKYTAAFSAYITQAAQGLTVHRGSVNHTFAGARFALERWHASPSGSIRDMTAELISFAAGSHHGQFDCVGENGEDGYLHRITAPGIGYEEATAAFLKQCAPAEELDVLFEAAVQEISGAMERCRSMVETEQEMLFQMSLLARHLLSAVIDGDRRDTAEFYLGETLARPDASADVWAERLSAVEARVLALPSQSAVDPARRQISDRCKASAMRGPGIYRLNVPTGGGKTLTALRYALAVAAQQGKKRIFFVIPLLSVLEQNAAVIRDYLGDDRLILEHHSNLIQEKQDGELDKNELLLESWHAPVVITTLVQLLDTLFAGKTSCIRRMASLRDSILILDEVQSVPRTMLSSFNMAMNYLSGVCGATVVLCSATQPCLERTVHRLRLSQPEDLVPYDAALWQTFRRTHLIDRRRAQGYSVEELADFAAQCGQAEGSLLLVCNTKAEARALFDAVRWRESGQVFHLSTAMCMAHRIQTLASITAALKAGERVFCISTQLVEAGVDVSFGCVIRILAGMDNIVQAAGRCNRSGEREALAPVYIVNLRGEQLSRLREIRQAQQATESLLLSFDRQPEAYGGELTSDQSIRAYYHALYTEMDDGAQDNLFPQVETTQVDLLSVNRVFRRRCATQGNYIMGQAFRTAGEQFHVFESNTVDVLVPFQEGETLIAELRTSRAEHDLGYRGALLKQAKRYTVALYDYQIRQLGETRGIGSLCQGTALALNLGFYSETTGVDLSGDANCFMEVRDGS